MATTLGLDALATWAVRELGALCAGVPPRDADSAMQMGLAPTYGPAADAMEPAAYHTAVNDVLVLDFMLGLVDYSCSLYYASGMAGWATLVPKGTARLRTLGRPWLVMATAVAATGKLMAACASGGRTAPVFTMR